jgi:hypothetical protein
MYKKTSSQASCLWKLRKELEDLPDSWLFLCYKKLSIFSSLLSDSFYSVCFVHLQTICENRFFHLCIRARAQMLELRKIHASSIRKARQWHCDYSFCKRRNEKKKKKKKKQYNCKIASTESSETCLRSEGVNQELQNQRSSYKFLLMYEPVDIWRRFARKSRCQSWQVVA